MAQAVIRAAKAKFADKIETSSHCGDEVISVSANHLLELVEFLRTDSVLLLDSPVFVTCIDRLGLAKPADNLRFEVVYQLRSSVHKHRVRIKVPLDQDKPELPSLSAIYPGFAWQERETYDMYGVVFKDHSDLRRIYMYEEFIGHPLRKDYPKDKRQPLVRRDWD